MPVVYHPHRPAGLAGEQGGVDREDRGVLLLAAERAAGLLLDDDDPVAIETERPHQGRVHVVRALQGAVDLDTPVLARDGDHRLRLEVQLLLVPRPVGALDHQVGPGEAGVEVSLVDLERLAEGRGLERVEHRGQRLGPESDGVAGSQGERPPGSRDQCHGFCDVTDLVGDQRRLVVHDQRDHVLARDVRRSDHDDARPVEGRVEVDPQQPRVRLGGTHGQAVPRPRDDEVVREARGARELVAPLPPERRASVRAADGSHRG